MMRKTIVVVVLAIVVAMAAAFGAVSRALKNEAAAKLAVFEQQLQERAGLVMETPNVSIGLFPPAAVLKGGKVREKGEAGSVVAEGGTIRLVAGVGDLLGGHLVPRRVELKGVRLVLRPDTSRSAVGLLSAAGEATVPVVLEDCVFQVDRGPSFPAFEVPAVDLTLAPAGGVVPFRGTLAVLGPASHGDLEGEWRPGTGRTGGDGLSLHLQVRDGEPEALGRLIPAVRVAQLKGTTRFDITADGFIGERTTETAPADPLRGRIRAESDFELFGLRCPAVFDSGFTLDDRRWTLDNGQGRWGERPFRYAGWIARGFGSNRANLRLKLEDVSVADVLADYGVSERWRPQADVTAEIRMGGTLDKPLTRYSAKVEDLRFQGFPDVPVSAGPLAVNGSLLAINADVSGSFAVDRLQVGNVHLEHLLIGANWWRDKLAVTTIGQRFWDGKLDAGVSYSPSESPDAKGGGLLHDADAKEALAAFFPDLDAGVEGRLNASVQGGYGAQGFWYEGRFGLNRGSIARGLVRAIADRVAAAAGSAASANDALVAEHPALSPQSTALTEVEGAFSAKQAPKVFEITKVSSDEVSLRAAGTLNEGKRVDGDGVATFAPALTSALARHAPALEKLVAEDGSVAVPFHVAGAVNDFGIALDPSFVAALEKARAGAPPQPFVAPAAPEPLTMDIPPLDEQFGE